MDRTNITDEGYTFGGQNYTSQTRTDASGNPYTVDVPTTISTASLTPTQQINVPTPTVVTPDTTGLSSYVQTASETATSEEEARKKALELSTTKSALETAIGGKATETVQAYKTG